MTHTAPPALPPTLLLGIPVYNNGATLRAVA